MGRVCRLTSEQAKLLDGEDKGRSSKIDDSQSSGSRRISVSCDKGERSKGSTCRVRLNGTPSGVKKSSVDLHTVLTLEQEGLSDIMMTCEIPSSLHSM